VGLEKQRLACIEKRERFIYQNPEELQADVVNQVHC